MRKWFYGILLILVLGILAYSYIYKSHRDIAKEEAAFVVEANALVDAFKIDMATAEQKYLNKTVELSGQVTQTDSLSVTLNHTAFCQLNTPNRTIVANTNLTLKGRVIGYDDLLGQIKLDQCIIINPKK